MHSRVHHQLPESTQTHVHCVDDLPSNHFILCRSLLLLPSIFPSIRIFSNESVLRIRWPKYWNFSFNISPSNEYSPRWAVGLGYRRGTTYRGAYMCFLEQRLSKTRTTILQKFETFQKKRDSSRIDIRDLCNAIIYTIVYISSL